MNPSPTAGIERIEVEDGTRRTVEFDLGSVLVTDASFDRGLRLPTHVHERTVVAVFLEGEMEVGIGGRTRECEAEWVLVEPIGEPHTQRFGDRGAHTVVLEPDPDDVDLADRLDGLDEVRCFPHARIGNLVRRLVRESRVPDDLAPLSSEALALEVLSMVAGVDFHERSGSRPPAWLRRVHDRIRDECLETPRLADLADEEGVHRSHLSRAFRRHYRSTPGQYLRFLRLEEAARLLRESEAPVAVIAARCGFSDQSHLTRSFKRHTGVTPAAFRHSD